MPTEISTPTAFTASNTTVILTIIGGGVIDVAVIVVITTTMNNLAELAMKRFCVEALPGSRPLAAFQTCASLFSCERVDRADKGTFRPRDNFSSFSL